MDSFDRQIDFLQRHSVFSSRCLLAHPDWTTWLAERQAQAVNLTAIKTLLEPAQCIANEPNFNELSLMTELRLARQKLMLWIGLRDLSGQASLAEVTEALSLFAEQAVAIAIAAARADLGLRFGFPWSNEDDREVPLMVVGMGKLGGYELNLSSDIDLIFLYESEGDTHGGERSLSNHEWFTRLGKRVIKFISDQDANGFVFRVDMRLRPNGDSGPLVCSLDMLEVYLTVQGREWERYAWIKGRLIYPLAESPDHVRCEKALDQLIRPFVYRRHLDYGVIAAIRDLHSQIQREAEKRSANRHGRSHDIKLGRGGIREIEFLAQMFQLMRGGTDPRFRIRPTLQVLALLGQQHLLPPEEVRDLSEAYLFLRRLEHRIQIWEDQQTHYFPEDLDSRTRLAEAMAGPGDSPNAELTLFLEQLQRHQDRVARLFEKAFALDDKTRLDTESITPDWQPDCERYPDACQRWQTWLDSSKQRSLPEKSRHIFNNLICKAAEQLDQEGLSPAVADQTLLRFFDLLEAIARRSAYLSILAEYPSALHNILALLQASQWGAHYLTRHPHLLDYLLATRSESELVDHPDAYWRGIKADLDMRLDDALAEGDGAAEHAMDILRVTHHTETFITLLADLGIGIAKPLSVEAVSDRLSALADLILQASFERIWPSVAKKYDLAATLPAFAVIAYGKLGGKELGYASDLDLVFLYDQNAAAQDTADFPAQEIFSLLAKRMINWLTAHTAAGTLFEIDTRLRPNGSAGFLVTSLDAFQKYQFREGDNAAWVWEHQALTRARFAAGNRAVAPQFEVIRAEVLSQVRDAAALRREILDMRRKVHAGHPNPSNQFDLKHDPGGMVDIEFIVQFLVLAFAHEHPRLIGNLGNIALLGIASSAGLISHSSASAVADAYRLLREQQHRLRLDGAEKTRVDLALHPDLREARAAVSLLWETIFKDTSNDQAG
jgi:glutamate-ammonia-ligase adenylyltransferase